MYLTLLLQHCIRYRCIVYCMDTDVPFLLYGMGLYSIQSRQTNRTCLLCIVST